MSNEGPLPVFPQAGEGSVAQGAATPYASWGRRILPYVFDSFLVGAIALVLTRLLGYHDPSTAFTYHYVNGTRRYDPVGTKLVAFGVIAAVVSFAYATAFLSSKLQATPFMRLFGLRIARADDLGRIGVATAALRAAIVAAITLASSFALILELFVGVDLLWPLWDARRQTVHDKLARTVVVRAPPRG